ncbi:MAG: hypothetical protein ACLR5S_02935, partial [Ruminococcus sp.]
FENVPKGVDFYVLETNANGVLADTDFGSYTSDSGIRYTSAPAAPAAVQAGGTAAITNTEEIDYSITVSKVLIADDVKSTPAFSVGLFTRNGNDYTQVGTTQKVAAGSEKFSTELNEQNKRYDLKEGIRTTFLKWTVTSVSKTVLLSRCLLFSIPRIPLRKQIRHSTFLMTAVMTINRLRHLP